MGLERFVTAVVGQPFALKGFVKARPLSGEAGHLLGLDSALIRDKMGERRLEIEAVEESGDHLLIKFKHIDTVDEAKALAGAEILVDREAASPLEHGEFYIEDLKGLNVVGEQGEDFGHIHDIVEGGGCDLVEIEFADGSRRFVPFRKEFFGEVSLQKQTAMLIAPWVLE